MSAALLRAAGDALYAAAGLLQEAEALEAHMRANPRPAEPVKPPSRHYLEEMDGDQRKPLCHARDRHGAGWARGYYTSDVADVTCKRCLKSLKKEKK